MPDRVFDRVVVDRQIAAFGITGQVISVVIQVRQGLAQFAFGCDDRPGRIQPLAQRLEYRQAFCLTGRVL